MHGTGAASDWVERWAPLVRAGGAVLDLACGAGRHTLLFAHRGHPVTAVDRDPACLQAIRESLAALPAARVETLAADIEGGPWPLPGQQFDAVVVTNYLWRPLWPTLLASLSPGGVLVVETFALGHERRGRPANPAFLLRPGELLEVTRGLHVVAFEDGLLGEPARRIQRVAAVRAPAGDPNSQGEFPLNPARGGQP